MEEGEKERQYVERSENIRVARYNKWYKEVKGQAIPEYLKKGRRESKWRKFRSR